MESADRIFWEAVDDLNAGRPQEPGRYLDLVPPSERDQLADLLAMLFASRTPHAQARQATAPSYSRALAAIEAVRERGRQSEEAGRKWREEMGFSS